MNVDLQLAHGGRLGGHLEAISDFCSASLDCSLLEDGGTVFVEGSQSCQSHRANGWVAFVSSEITQIPTPSAANFSSRSPIAQKGSILRNFSKI
jgi:hypothetical protein